MSKLQPQLFSNNVLTNKWLQLLNAKQFRIGKDANYAYHLCLVSYVSMCLKKNSLNGGNVSLFDLHYQGLQSEVTTLIFHLFKHPSDPNADQAVQENGWMDGFTPRWKL